MKVVRRYRTRVTTPPLRSTDATGAPHESAAPLRRFRPAFWFGGWNGVTWMISLGTPMVLLAQHLGASAFQVGLASSFAFLLLPIQVVATAALPYFGFRRQMVSAWLTRAAFLLVPLGLAWAEFDDPQPWMPWALVASVFGFCLCRSFGTAAHLPWMAVIVPLELRGRFFATDHAVTSMVGVGTLLACAALFAGLPAYEAFRVVYAAALIGAMLAVWNLARLPAAAAPAAPPLRAMAGRALRLCTQPGRFRHYLLVASTGSAVVTSSFVPFTVYYLKVERGLASSELMLFTAAQFAGQILGAAGIRGRVDRMPLPRFFQLALLALGAVDIFWLCLLVGFDALLAWVGLSFFLFGLGLGITNVAHFTYLPELAGDEERPVTMAIFTAAQGLLSGLAPMLWGLALRESGTVPGMRVENFVVFFLVATAVSALLLVLYGRLPDLRPGFRRARP